MKRIYCLLTVHITSVILSSSVLPYPYKTHKSSRSLTSHQVQVVSCFDVNPDLIRNALNSALRSNGVLDFQSNVQFYPGKCDDVRFVLHLSELLNAASPKLWIILVNSRSNRQLFETVLLSLTENWNDTVILRTVDTELISSSDEYSTSSDDMERMSNFVKYFLDSLSWKRIRIFSTNNNAYLTLAKSIELALRRKNFPLKSSVVLVGDLKSTLNSSKPSKFKVLIFCGQLFSAEWYDIVEQAENSKSETVAMISFNFAQNNDISSKLENSSSKILLFVVTWSGVITNSRKNSEENQNQFGDVFSFAGKLITSNYKTRLIRFTDSYGIPGPGSELVPVKLPDGSDAFISLTEASRSLITARRYRNLELFQWIPPERNFLLIAKSSMNNSYIASSSVQWPNGTNSNQNECKDQDDQEGCDDTSFVIQLGDKTSILSILLGLLGLIILSGVTAFAVRWNFLRRRALKGPHKILFTSGDLIMSQKDLPRPDLIRGSSTSVVTVASHTKRQLSGHMRPRSAIPESTARYNGELVHLRYLADQLGGNFEIKTKAIDVLESLQLLRSENLNPIIGCLCDTSKPALLYEHCSRGSLYDVLKRKDVTLDWQFKLSLLTDLVRGMRYLHNSPLQHHGRLTSLNCVIDSRWVLKITDYGLNLFEQAQGLSWKKPTLKHLLWTAPELLRDETLLRRGNSAGDIYSFSIIVQEVLTQEEPFAMLAMSTEEIIGKLRKPPPLIRPSVSKGAAPPELINLMRQCWSEAPDSRPSFNEVYDTFKKFNQGKKANIVDSMFEMLEKYSNNLEDLIQERTDQLESERRKTEQLLNRMLPSSVAEKLKLGLPVEPEQFDEVTIYFSDIVGFTTISAYSTPIQIVNLLNDLYTCFDATISSYNVYKVETIGDAYMVVGGLPVCSTDHAEQVATMALDLLSEAGRFEIRHLPGTPLRLRIGIHTGSCCAGVVGLTMPRFCLFGDTVNTASRMESTGAAWRIHLSDTTYVKLEAAGGYQMTYRGLTELKGKGQHPTYWLLNKDGFQKPLPVPPELGESNHGLDKSLIKSIEGDSGTENGGH